MKKYFSIILLGSTLLTTSCVQEEDLLFEKSAAERLNEASQIYSDYLLEAPHGWVLEYFPQASTAEDKPLIGSGFLMLAKFESDHSVLVGMNNFLSRNVYLEDRSVWEVITDNGPVLSFNSFNKCIHAFSNPEDISGTSDNETGKGMQGDYEFVMVDVPQNGNYIMLKGKKRGSYSRLTKLEEETDFSEYLTDVNNFKTKAFDPKAPNHLVVTIGGERYRMIMAQDGGVYGVTKMWPYDSDSTFTKVIRPMIVTRHGVKDAYNYSVRFRNEVTNTQEESEQEFLFDASTKKFIGVNDNANTIEGPEPTEFVYDRLNLSASFALAANSDMSDELSTAVSCIAAEFKAVKYTFRTITFRKNEDVIRASISYRNSKSQNVTTNFNFNFSREENGGICFEYVGPIDASGETLLKSIPSIETFFNAFVGTYKVEWVDTPLNLSKVKFVSGDKYFVVSPVF